MLTTLTTSHTHHRNPNFSHFTNVLCPMFKIVHVVRWKSDVQNVKLVGYIFSPNSTTRRRGWWWRRRRRCPWWNEKFQFSKKGEQTSRGRGKSGKRGIETDEWMNERTDVDHRPHDQTWNVRFDSVKNECLCLPGPKKLRVHKTNSYQLQGKLKWGWEGLMKTYWN